MEQNDPAFEELARRIGRFFLSWASLESALNVVLAAIIENYVDPSAPFDKPRNLSKKTEFIRRFFRDHPSWKFLGDVVASLMNSIDYMADARHALAHGQMMDLDSIVAGSDIVILLNKRSKGKEQLLHFTFTHDQLLQLGRRAFVEAVFTARLAEIVADDLGEHDLENLMQDIVREVG